MSSFLLIILLYGSFILISQSYFKKKLHEEVVTYSGSNHASMSRDFEQYFQVLNSVTINYFISNDYINSNNNSFRKDLDYVSASDFISSIHRFVLNPQLFLKNMLVFDAHHSLVFDNARGQSPEAMFQAHYGSPKYSSEFWEQEIASGIRSKMYPATVLSVKTGSEPNQIMPYLVKSVAYPNFAILAFIDIKPLFRDINRMISGPFYILDSNGSLLYSTDTADISQFPRWDSNRKWLKKGGSYYFYEKGENTGFTYVQMVPDEQIASLASMNITLTVLFLVSILIGVLASVFFSMRFNNPLKEIIQSIRQFNQDEDMDRINEFDLIRTNIHRIVSSKSEYQEMEKHKSSLKYYAYMNRVKRIRGIGQELNQQDEEQRPYRFILVQLSFKRKHKDDLDQERIVYYIREFIDLSFKEAGSSHTFQIESNQVLTIVYENPDQPDLMDSLLRLKSVVDNDGDYLFATVAVSRRFEHASDMTAAYEELLDLIKYRPFTADSQIVYETQTTAKRFVPSITKMQEIDINLQEGNPELVMQSLKSILLEMKSKNAGMYLFHRFFGEIHEKISRMHLHAHTEGIPEVNPNDIHCIEDIEHELEISVQKTTSIVKLRKEKEKSIVSLVLKYIEEHYEEDVTLDSVAGKLGITGRYLSMHFKERTGVNFTDKVNEVRVHKAMELLKKTDLQIQEIAAQTGYNTLSSFNRSFKKIAGVTPRAYRRSIDS